MLTLAATLSPLANGAARVFWGWASDRLGRENTMVLTFVLQAICLRPRGRARADLRCWFSTTLVAVYFTWGQIYSLFPSMSADYFGTKHATSNYAVLYTAKGVASAIGGWARRVSLRADRQLGHGFYVSAVMALVAAVLAFGLARVAGDGESQGREDPRAGVIDSHACVGARGGVCGAPASCTPPSAREVTSWPILAEVVVVAPG